MDNSNVAGWNDHEGALDMCKAYSLIRKNRPIETEIEEHPPDFPDNVNPRPCSTSDGSLLKNALCHRYDQCLSLAVEKKWSQFTCIDCSFKNIQMKMEWSEPEILGCWRLIFKLFMAKRGNTAFLNIGRPHGPVIFDRNEELLE